MLPPLCLIHAGYFGAPVRNLVTLTREARFRLVWGAVDMNDESIHESIEKLVAEEHALFDKGTSLTAKDRRRLNDVNVQLDRLWDLLRQRRARAEFGRDPNASTERSAETVEKYLG